MTATHDQHGEAGDSGNRQKSEAVLSAILADADPATWYPGAPKIKSAWEPYDLCDLRGSRLSNQRIGEVMMAECALDDADFSGSSFDKTAFQGSTASRAKFAGTRLVRTQMMPFFGSQLDFSGAIFEKVALSTAKLLDSTFISATLDDVSLSDADLSQSSFVGARVKVCRFDNAILRNTDLGQATFAACDLRRTVFQNAQMKGAVLENCEMMGTDFRGANLDGALIRGGTFGVYQQGDALTPVRFDDTPGTRRLVAESGAEGIGSIEWVPPSATKAPSPKNVAAGQPCPLGGFWFTPAHAGSRRYFKAGDVMPEVGGDYGATIWHRDQNQDPPKL